MVQPYNEIILSNKIEQTSYTQNNMYESRMRYAEYKKPVAKAYIAYKSNKTVGTGNRSVVARIWGLG